MTASANLDAVKAMLLDALTSAMPPPQSPGSALRSTYPQTVKPLTHVFAGTAGRLSPPDSVAVHGIIDADKLATTVAEWFAARKGDAA